MRTELPPLPELHGLFIDGSWVPGEEHFEVVDPATEEVLGELPHATTADLDRALEAARRSFPSWRAVPPHERGRILRRAAELLRERSEHVARIATMEEGKPLAESRREVEMSAEIFEWYAEEGRRAYGRVLPQRATGVRMTVLKEPVGPVAAFAPWNFPIGNPARKIGAALAAGCPCILKPAEETPATALEVARALVDAGLPQGVLSIVFGVPAEVSAHLLASPVIRAISFTGSIPVGKQLMKLAAEGMKRTTMELGGHGPVLVFDDVDLEQVLDLSVPAKYRNAGQVCVSPTRFLVHESVYGKFVEGFTAFAKSLKVGDGLDKDTRMGPLANDRRVQAMEMFVADAVSKGAKIETGGKRIGNKGNFFEPTVLTNITTDMRIMNEEPFGPLAPIMPFSKFDEVVEEANRLPFGLAAYAYTKSAKTAAAIGAAFESGMVSINHHGLALPEVPFGGIKDSGYGSEGGAEAIEAYLNTKFITQVGL